MYRGGTGCLRHSHLALPRLLSIEGSAGLGRLVLLRAAGCAGWWQGPILSQPQGFHLILA